MRFHCSLYQKWSKLLTAVWVVTTRALFQVPSVPEELFFTTDVRQEGSMMDTVTSAQALVS